MIGWDLAAIIAAIISIIAMKLAQTADERAQGRLIEMQKCYLIATTHEPPPMLTPYRDNTMDDAYLRVYERMNKYRTALETISEMEVGTLGAKDALQAVAKVALKDLPIMRFNQWLQELDVLHNAAFGKPVGGDDKTARKHFTKKVKQHELFKKYTPKQAFELIRDNMKDLMGD